MEKSKLETKHKEIIFKTANLDEMKGNFTVNRVLRCWSEDFVDEDNGEVVSIERKEIILDRGVLLDSTTLSTINFHLSTGDITEVEVSNQKRDGLYTDGYTSTWIVSAVILGKKKNIYLYSNSAFTALEIAKDYIEQKYPGSFSIPSVKEADSTTLITNLSSESEGEIKHYKIEVEIEKEEISYNNAFIVQATNAENGKALIDAYLKRIQTEKKDEEEITLTLVSAKVIPCEAVIDANFCKEYLKDE